RQAQLVNVTMPPQGAYTVLTNACACCASGGVAYAGHQGSYRRRRTHQPRNLRLCPERSGAGYGVDVAATAAAAVMLLSSTHYRLVIADWLLPDGDGIYIADRALALGSRTLIVTGHLPDLPPGTGLRHRLLLKPVKPAELTAVVRDMIGEPPAGS